MNKYKMTDGVIYRDGEKIATRDAQTGTLDYLPGMDRYRAPVAEFIKTLGLDKPPVVPPEVAARQGRIRTAGEDPTPSTSATVGTEAPRVESETVAPFATVTPAEPVAERELTELERLQAENAELKRRLAMRHPVASAVEAPAHEPLSETYADEGAPAMTPEAGDKTPAFVDWLYQHHPEQAQARYGFRKTHRS